jgi:hypothetical protein
MSAPEHASSVASMDKVKNLQWPLIVGLGAFALVRPLVSIIEDQLGVTDSAAVPIMITVVISAVWAVVVGLSKVAHPVLTLLFTGLTYAVLSIILSGILSPILTGKLQGPLATPIAIIPDLLVNAGWGVASGGLALLIQRIRGNHRAVDQPSA